MAKLFTSLKVTSSITTFDNNNRHTLNKIVHNNINQYNLVPLR